MVNINSVPKETDCPTTESGQHSVTVTENLADTMVRDDADALHYLLNSNPLQSDNLQHSSLDGMGERTRAQSFETGSAHLPLSDAMPKRTSTHTFGVDNNRVVDAVHDPLAHPVILSAEQFSLWSQFESCAQRFLSPVEAATYVN